MKRTPLRRVSVKQAARKREYAKIVPGWMERHPYCEIGPVLKEAGYNVACQGYSTHPHHVKGRLGSFLCDTRYWLASCSGECHPQFIHQTHKDIAIKLGLLIQ